MSGDANTFASIGKDNTLKIWDARINDCVSSIHSNAGSAYMNDLTMTSEYSSPQRNLATVGFNDGTVTTWDLSTQ